MTFVRVRRCTGKKQPDGQASNRSSSRKRRDFPGSGGAHCWAFFLLRSGSFLVWARLERAFTHSAGCHGGCHRAGERLQCACGSARGRYELNVRGVRLLIRLMRSSFTHKSTKTRFSAPVTRLRSGLRWALGAAPAWRAACRGRHWQPRASRDPIR